MGKRTRRTGNREERNLAAYPFSWVLSDAALRSAKLINDSQGNPIWLPSGLDDSAFQRVRVPAGLDLGHVEHREIAVAILAELVQMRASGELVAGVAVTDQAPSEAVDPVCGMTVEIAMARWVSTHDDTTYYFCSAGCQKAFERAPAAFLGV